ncbi:UNVERIFIED_CONTAM: protein RER1A [Sesamum latifolium]|uniref:Protein RER1A n=1 Tax=Sesamum latifolium TaxID=2727402 RepID=A0AAW2V397_9LAMI
MDGVGGDGTSTATAALNQRRHEVSKLFQYYLDKSTPHALYRWIGTFLLMCLYALRVYYVQGFYIVTYGLGIYILNLLIGFLSPLVDPELEPTDGPLLPTKGSDEFKPFIRRLPEFKFWYAITKAFCVAFVMTFFSMFDVPVFWPILLCYWLVLFVLTMKRQIMHMIKYKYIPFNIGKQLWLLVYNRSTEVKNLLRVPAAPELTELLLLYDSTDCDKPERTRDKGRGNRRGRRTKMERKGNDGFTMF